LDSLGGKSSERAVRRELEELTRDSGTYDTAYDKAMQRIQDQVADRRNMAIEVLSWVTCAMRPLKTVELLHALAVELGKSEFNEDNLPDVDDVISVCAGLITITGDTVRLVHYTAKEYFERKWTSWFPDGHNSIATTCVTYLSFDAFQSGMCLNDTDFEARLRQYPLYSYAAKNWGHHARVQSVDEQLLIAFLDDTRKINACVQEIFATKGFSSNGDYSQQVPLGFTSMHLVAFFGLDRVVQFMIQHRDELHAMDSMGRTPFLWAVCAGHCGAVKLLLGHCAYAEIPDLEGRTPISLAASAGWADIVSLLLDSGVDPDSRDIDDQTPLSWAAHRGRSEVVQLLVKRGADLDCTDFSGRTPLSWAAGDGRLEIVQFLLEQHVDMEFKDCLGRTPISWAAENGHTAVVRLLLEARKAHRGTPLYSGQSTTATALSPESLI
jgi:ankyrin repeat protein